MRGGRLIRKHSLLFLIALIIGLGLVYVVINQAYDTGNAFWFSKPVPCFDSDQGLNFSIAGYVQYGSSRRFDFCLNNSVVESWCSMRGGPTFTRYNCPFGCEAGACISGTLNCSDSDGGLDYYVKGNASLTLNGIPIRGKNSYDYCTDLGNELMEFQCKDNNILGIAYNCSEGCKDGACIRNVKQPCNDSDGGLDYLRRGTLKTTISNNSDIEISDFCCATYDPNNGSGCVSSKEGKFVSEFICSSNSLDHYKAIFYECPYGCYEGQCLKNACSDECSNPELKECFQIGVQAGIRSCGNYDSDPCLEWKNSYCPTGSICKNGSCLQSDMLDLGFLSERIRVCAENCENLPTPVFKVCPTDNPGCSPKNYSFIEFYLGGLPLLTFQTPIEVYREGVDWTGGKGYSYTENFKLNLVDAKGVVTNKSNHFRFEGTNKFLFYQDDFMDGSNPLVLTVDGIDKRFYKPENITAKYKIVKKEGNPGSLRLIKRQGFEYDLDTLYPKVLEITQNVDRLTNKNHVNFTVWLLPDPLSNYMGYEGNLYMGNGVITIHYIESNLDNGTKALAHEYTHSIQAERGPIGNYLSNPEISHIRGTISCFAEGMADGVSVHLGYSNPEKLESGNQPEKGCVISKPDLPHTVGRCIFKYLRADHIDSDSFYKSIFSPNHYYDFNTCDLSLRKTCDSYNILFSEASGQDLTQFMTQKIGGNCSPTLEEAKRNIGIV